MAVQTSDGSAYLQQDGTFVNTTEGFTFVFWAQFASYPTVGNWIYLLDLTDAGYTLDLFIGINDAQQLELYLQNNLGDTVSHVALGAMSLNTWYGLAVTVNPATNTVNFYKDVNGNVIRLSSDAFNFNSGVFEYMTSLAYGGTLNSLAYFRGWSTVLSVPQIATELNSSAGLYVNNMIINTPLTTSADLNDISGNGHNWTAYGSINTVAPPFAPNNGGCIPSLSNGYV